MKHYDAIIFDLDGTLLDTLKDLTEAVNYVNRTMDFPLKSREEVRLALGNGVAFLIDRTIPFGKENPHYQSCIEKFQTYYKSHMQDHTCPFEQIPRLLSELKRQGKKLAVVSNKFQLAVEGLCQAYFPQVFEVAIGESPSVARKPAPDMLLHAVKRLDSTKEKTLYVGDSEVDILTAQNAGIDCISVTWGFREEGFLKQKGAALLARSPGELLELLGYEGDQETR